MTYGIESVLVTPTEEINTNLLLSLLLFVSLVFLSLKQIFRAARMTFAVAISSVCSGPLFSFHRCDGNAVVPKQHTISTTTFASSPPSVIIASKTFSTSFSSLTSTSVTRNLAFVDDDDDDEAEGALFFVLSLASPVSLFRHIAWTTSYLLFSSRRSFAQTSCPTPPVAPNTIAIRFVWSSSFVSVSFVDATATARRRRSRREGLLDDDDDDEVAFNEGAAAERIVMVLKRVFVMTKRYAKITQM
tara:strand:- start:331 stop:1065 length:735 start_codon:yes stop_codon:yes gene_type:complete